MIISAVIALLALLLVVANITVTIATARSELFEPLQKKASIVLFGFSLWLELACYGISCVKIWVPEPEAATVAISISRMTI